MSTPQESYREGVNIILEDAWGCVALQLRDDPRFSGFWGLFGGWIEPGENPYEAVIRETREELSIDLDASRLDFVGVYLIHVIRARDYVFRYPVTDELDTAVLNEGMAFQLVARADMQPEKMIPYHYDLLEWYWSGGKG